MQTIFILLLFVLLGLIAYLMFFQWGWFSSNKNISENQNTLDLDIKGNRFLVEIADNNEKRQKGLMERESMEDSKGMLFIFERSSVYPFWMKNTKINLDIIWINEKKEIVYIFENAKPCDNAISAICNSIVPHASAKYVLEINGGLSKKLELKVGDKVEFNVPN